MFMPFLFMPTFSVTPTAYDKGLV